MLPRPRLTAKNAAIVLLVWLSIALLYYLKVELDSQAPSSTNDWEASSVDREHYFSDDGNEPYVRAGGISWISGYPMGRPASTASACPDSSSWLL
jgi:hypothetical protein